MKKSLLMIAFAGSTLFACDQLNLDNPITAKQPPKTSGVHGQALRGPVHNGPVEAGDNAYIGFEAVFYLNNDSGELVTTFNSDSNGMFSLNLAPGNYEIVIADTSAPIINTQQQTQVTVVKDKFLNIVLHFDSAN